MEKTSRRQFMKRAGAAAIGAAVAQAATFSRGGTQMVQAASQRTFKISLAGWSMHRALRDAPSGLTWLDMPRLAREEFGIDGLEIVNTLMGPPEPDNIAAILKQCEQYKVQNVLIMVDREGDLGAESEADAMQSVTNHSKWVDAAADLGCHAIRVNWRGAPNEIVQDPHGLKAFIDRSVKPFRALADYGDKKNIDVIIENHGGPSSYPEAVVHLMTAVDHERFGTLPDFGNFPEEVDKYLAIDILMSYAKAVSAKCYDFDDATGLETKLDYPRIIEIVVDKHGYDGFIGIEYEGDRLSEPDGIKACKKLLDSLKA